MIYFDNAATTIMLPEVFESMKPYFLENYYNPNSKYYHGAEKTRSAIENARVEISEVLKCLPEEIIFTSGATESNNHILKSLKDRFEEFTILTTKIEHSSIASVLDELAHECKILYVDLENDGTVNLDDLESKIKNNNVSLCTINYVNSEVGIVQDLKSIGSITSKYNVLFHSDITQAIGKIEFDFNEFSNLNFASLSAHKFHGPKGIGILVLRKDRLGIKFPLKPLLHGGEQEFNYRAGTLNTPNIIGMSVALRIAHKNLENNKEIVKTLDKAFINFFNSIESVQIINKQYKRVPGYISLRIKGVNNQIFLKKIGSEFAASTGSACSNSSPSKTLLSLGHDMTVVRETIRITLNHKNTVTEIEKFCSIFKAVK